MKIRKAAREERMKVPTGLFFSEHFRDAGCGCCFCYISGVSTL